VCLPLHDILIDLTEVRGEIELSGLNDGACGRGGIVAPFSSTVSKKGRLGT
jgi:hypothetical protein